MELSRVVKPPVFANQKTRPGGCGGTLFVRLPYVQTS